MKIIKGNSSFNSRRVIELLGPNNYMKSLLAEGLAYELKVPLIRISLLTLCNNTKEQVENLVQTLKQVAISIKQ